MNVRFINKLSRFSFSVLGISAAVLIAAGLLVMFFPGLVRMVLTYGVGGGLILCGISAAFSIFAAWVKAK